MLPEISEQSKKLKDLVDSLYRYNGKEQITKELLDNIQGRINFADIKKIEPRCCFNTVFRKLVTFWQDMRDEVEEKEFQAELKEIKRLRKKRCNTLKS